jgi:hypothetical protein
MICSRVGARVCPGFICGETLQNQPNRFQLALPLLLERSAEREKSEIKQQDYCWDIVSRMLDVPSISFRAKNASSIARVKTIIQGHRCFLDRRLEDSDWAMLIGFKITFFFVA